MIEISKDLTAAIKENQLCLFIFYVLFPEADHELLELAASFQSPPGRPAASIQTVARRVRGSPTQDNKPRFVSAFCQSNCGDVSPNVLGAFCIDTGLPCDFNHSTCGGKNELCYGRGPGYLSLCVLKFFWLFNLYVSYACVYKLHSVFKMAATLMNLKVHVLLERGNSEKL